MTPDPQHPGKHIDPATGCWPVSEWGHACARGFVSNARFGPSDRVIPRMNRNVTKQWRTTEVQRLQDAPEKVDNGG
jgi:hypothetical protein